MNHGRFVLGLDLAETSGGSVDGTSGGGWSAGGLAGGGGGAGELTGGKVHGGGGRSVGKAS